MALGGVACAISGAALGTTGLAGPPSSHLTAALLMIGKCGGHPETASFPSFFVPIKWTRGKLAATYFTCSKVLKVRITGEEKKWNNSRSC